MKDKAAVTEKRDVGIERVKEIELGREREREWKRSGRERERGSGIALLPVWESNILCVWPSIKVSIPSFFRNLKNGNLKGLGLRLVMQVNKLEKLICFGIDLVFVYYLNLVFGLLY